MNTIKSVYYGWGTLIVAGGGAYYFAKKSINADRAAKAEADRQKRVAQYELEAAHFNHQSATPPFASTNRTSPTLSTSQLGKKTDEMGKGDMAFHEQVDEASHPSHEASKDPAPTRHAPEEEAQKMKEKSKYTASEVYRSRKGDRFS